MIFVDDGSTDGTARRSRRTARTSICRSCATRSTAAWAPRINSGLRAALGEAQDDDAIVTLEADNTSDLDDLPRMLERFQQGYDVVLASVYAPGGQILGVAPWRLAASKAVSGTFRRLGGLQGDPHAVLPLPRLPRRHAAPRRRDLRLPAGARARASPPTSSCCSSSTTPAPRSPRCRRSTTGAGAGRLEDDLKPTVLAYGRLMAAHLVGRIQPPPISPLAEDERAAATARAACGRSRDPRVGIVGGGVLGTSSSLRLPRRARQVTLLERGPTLGGLAGAMDFGGHRVDRFYHVIVPRTSACSRSPRRSGSATSCASARRRRLLRRRGDVPVQRPRRLRALPAAVAARARAAGVVRGPVPAARRLRRRSRTSRSSAGCAATAATQVVERIWRPLLDSRFDSDHDELPATYLWARTNRMRSARARRRAPARRWAT